MNLLRQHSESSTRVGLVTIALALSILLSLLAFPLPATAATTISDEKGWIWQNPLPQGNALQSIHFSSDKMFGVAVGSDGTLIYSSDGGFNWRRADAQSDAVISAVFVRDEVNAVAIGARGVILLTEDGGGSWRKIQTAVRDHLSGIVFTGEGLRYGTIVGTYGRILKSTDGGRTWIEKKSPTDVDLVRISAKDSSHLAVVSHYLSNAWAQHQLRLRLPAPPGSSSQTVSQGFSPCCQIALLDHTHH